MKIITNVFGSSLGKKYVMAVTGFFLFLFVVGHLVGNLQIFLGPEAINRYGHLLQSNVELLWPVRLGLLVIIGLHIWSAVKLEAENRAARPIGYGEYRPVGSTLASRTMLVSGLIVFCFIVYHILHYTVRVDAINFTGESFRHMPDAESRHDVFRMMVIGFSNPFVSLCYFWGRAALLSPQPWHQQHVPVARPQEPGLSPFPGYGRAGGRVRHLPRLRLHPHRGAARLRKVGD